MRARLPISHVLNVADSGLVALYLYIGADGTTQQDKNTFTVEETGVDTYIYKVTLNSTVPINATDFANTSLANDQLNAGPTKTFSVNVQASSATAANNFADVSTVSIDSDGRLFFYVRLWDPYLEGAYIKVITTSLIK